MEAVQLLLLLWLCEVVWQRYRGGGDCRGCVTREVGRLRIACSAAVRTLVVGERGRVVTAAAREVQGVHPEKIWKDGEKRGIY